MIAQIGILLFGMSAAWVVNDGRPNVRKWGAILGMCSQPFWFYTTYTHGQWGIFAMAFFYTYCWARGIHNNWFPSREIS